MVRSSARLPLATLGVLLAIAGCEPARNVAPAGPAPMRASQAPAAADIEQLAMSPSGFCGVLAAGTARCWGRWSSELIKLGLPVEDMTGVAEVRIGNDPLRESQQRHTNHLCVRVTDRGVQCWGNGRQGQLGPAGGDDSTTPVAVDPLSGATQLALGGRHSCALTSGRDVVCWGSNQYGQLGIGHGAEIVRQPTSVSLPRKVTQLVASDFDTCALADDHEVYCWGENLRGEAGAPNPAASRGLRIAWAPYHVEFASGAHQISAAFAAACAVKLDGTIVCWGYLTDKLGPAFDTATHGDVPDIRDATAVAVGYSHACAIRSDASLWCWGTGDRGALGDGRCIDAWRPRQVVLPGRALQVVAGMRSTCARLEDRRWYCWGDNQNGAIAGRDEPPLLTPAPLDLSRVE